MDHANDPMPIDARGGVVRDSVPLPTRRPSCAPRESRPKAMVLGYETLDDPQMRARGLLRVDRQPARGTARISVVADADVGRLAALVGRVRRRRWSQFTDEVLLEIGVTDEELAHLRDEHVIGDAPYFGWR